MTVRALSIACALMTCPLPLAAQRIEITPFAGWQFAGELGTRDGELSISPDVDFGGTISVSTAPGAYAEFVYNRQKTTLRFQEGDFAVAQDLFDLVIEYFQIGGLRELRDGPLRPYGAATVGATHYNPSDANRASEWRFSGSLATGVKAFGSGRIGVRAQLRGWFTLFSEAEEVFCTLPGGCIVGVSGSLVTQGEISAGITVAFGELSGRRRR